MRRLCRDRQAFQPKLVNYLEVHQSGLKTMVSDEEKQRQDYDAGFTFVWVFMSEFSDSGVRGAPSGVFHSVEEAEEWIKASGVQGNLYRFPLGHSLVEYCEPVSGDIAYIRKYSKKDTPRYRAGNDYLGIIPHEHYFKLNE